MNNHDKELRLVTASVAAASLGITVGKFNELGRRGIIPRYKFGHRTYRYNQREVLTALREEGGSGGLDSEYPLTVAPSAFDKMANDVVRSLVKP